MISSNTPLYPIDVNDYPKLFDYVLTADGLVYFQSLRRTYNQGKVLSLDEYNKLLLLYIYYATANRNTQEVSAWQDLCMSLDEKGIFEKNMFQSKESLKKEFFITENPLYLPGLYRKHTDYIKNYFKT